LNRCLENIVAIRDLRSSDLPAILEIERASFPDPWSIDSFRSSVNNASFKCLGAFNPHLNGYIISIFAVGELHILNIAVAPDFRRQGLAGKLIDALINNYRSQLFYVYLEVRISNTTAIEFYRKRGFVEVGLRKKYYPNGEDALLMTLQI